MASPFVFPIIAMICLTAIVLGVAVANRVVEIYKRRISLQSLARASDTAKVLQNTQAIDNFNNLMQLPILFYLLCLALMQMGDGASIFFVVGTWLYTILRMLHSVIQITYNRVLHRFYVWATSTLVLFTLWGKFAFLILVK